MSTKKISLKFETFSFISRGVTFVSEGTQVSIMLHDDDDEKRNRKNESKNLYPIKFSFSKMVAFFLIFSLPSSSSDLLPISSKKCTLMNFLLIKKIV
jgi:hypothetical protein